MKHNLKTTNVKIAVSRRILFSDISGKNVTFMYKYHYIYSLIPF